MISGRSKGNKKYGEGLNNLSEELEAEIHKTFGCFDIDYSEAIDMSEA